MEWTVAKCEFDKNRPAHLRLGCTQVAVNPRNCLNRRADRCKRLLRNKRFEFPVQPFQSRDLALQVFHRSIEVWARPFPTLIAGFPEPLDCLSIFARIQEDEPSCTNCGGRSGICCREKLNGAINGSMRLRELTHPPVAIRNIVEHRGNAGRRRTRRLLTRTADSLLMLQGLGIATLF